jgi:hypothetical protein
MLDLISMWKNPKMIIYFALTAVIYPFQQFTVFAGHADYLRVRMGIPMAFSFLFGPAAALGTAVGNLIYDASTNGIRWISLFGFIGNFLIAYLPYKLWNAITAQKPDVRNIKKIALFVGITFVACCGLCNLRVNHRLGSAFDLRFAVQRYRIHDCRYGCSLGADFRLSNLGIWVPILQHPQTVLH